MTELSHKQQLILTWVGAGPSKREELRRTWPELADAIDAVTWRPEGEKIDVQAGLRQVLTTAKARRVAKNNEPRCKAMHDPGTWPYTARCVMTEDHPLPNDHIDKDGKEWKELTSCDGCRTIERKRLEIPAGDEEAFYQFQRAERLHRRECPNR